MSLAGMTAAESCLALLDNAVGAQVSPRLAAETLAKASRGVRGLAGRRDEAAVAVPAILRTLGAPDWA